MPALKMEQRGNDAFKSIWEHFENVTTEPEQYLVAQPTKCNEILDILQGAYQIAHTNDAVNNKSAVVLSRLVTDEMDEEQIWQQLEMRNDVVWPQLLEQTSKLLAMQEQKLEVRLKEDESEAEEEEDNDENAENFSDEISDDEFEENDHGDNNDDEDERDFGDFEKKKPKRNLRKSVVDDEFFKLGEMEEFLEAEDAKDIRKQSGKLTTDDDDGIDYFADDFGDDDVEDEEEEEAGLNLKYGDFFDANDAPKESKVVKKPKGKDHFDAYENDEEDQDDLEAGEEEQSEAESDIEEESTANIEPASDSNSGSDAESNEDEEEKPKSSFELRQQRLEQRIQEYEQVVLGEKPWQLKGEIQATSRPQNSLLQEILEFDSTVRPAPVITEETTRRLEDIIKQRIKDQAWDDVIRTVRPVQTPQEYRKQLVLDQEKSKESLAQIYEKEYQREIDKLKPNGTSEVAEDENKDHQQIRSMMNALFVKLDALSNFHFTPKPVAPEPKIITNTPAIAMEEVAPVGVSDANLLAPEEVYRGPKHELVGKTERNRTDKNRERRKKKSKQQAIHKALEAKDLHRQKLGIPLSKKEESAKLLKQITKHRNVEKVTVSTDNSALKSSKAFFSKLQDTKSSSNAAAKASKRKPDSSSLSAKKLKL